MRISPAWTRWSYRILLLGLAASLVFATVGRVHEYANGEAVIRIGDRIDVTSRHAGIVASIAVAPGQGVVPGQVLVRFHQQQERAQLARIDHELDLQLINRLRDPTDRTTEQALLALRAQRQLALASLEQRQLRASVEGVVGDLRLQPGQYVTPGEILLSIIHGVAHPSAIVVMPGTYRPMLEPGMSLRLEVAGYRQAVQRLVIETVGDQVLSPAEARRVLGPAGANAVAIEGPVTIVEAALPSLTFEAAGETFRYHDGMRGTAEVRVRSETLLLTLIPALGTLTRPADG